jgi:hypothetical protein
MDAVSASQYSADRPAQKAIDEFFNICGDNQAFSRFTLRTHNKWAGKIYGIR